MKEISPSQNLNVLEKPLVQKIINLDPIKKLEKSSAQSQWSIQDSEELYGINRWGIPYFSINNLGHITVAPKGNRGRSLDLFKLVKALEERSLNLPLLIHFPDIIEDRIEELNSCFAHAITRYNYEGSYQGVFPIKVNQQRHIVQAIVNCGNNHKYGLEVGSKPELLIALAQLKESNALLICNGYKDQKYIETALLARRLGYQTIVVVEQLSEIKLAIDTAKTQGIRPVLGIRAKLSSKGDSRWGNSAGDKAKFGLTISEIMEAIEQLKAAEMLESLQLLHFHIGSQISSIATIKEALTEASQIYVNLSQLGASMKYFDVGGGLGIDYDGSHSHFPASKNYSMQNYANDVVAAIKIACETQKLKVPIIISESGRAIASHQSVLLTNVLGVDKIPTFPIDIEKDKCHSLVQEMANIYDAINSANCQESYHDILQLKKEGESLFSFGYLNLKDRAKVESLFWQCCQRIQGIVNHTNTGFDGLETLNELLFSTYYCNFSVFQSLPDSWAIEQLFPVMPIHRLNEKPTELGILADLTCDSDGQIAKFIGSQEVKPHLELHQFYEGQPYYLGIFLSGAYQEIMGSLHNLFGDTNAVHVRLDSEGYHIEHVVRGNSMAEVLKYVQYDSQDMVETMRQKTEKALKEKRLTLKESWLFLKHYEEALCNYTYLR
ncbi:arginine decarboxylase [Crocosphaera chwakensis CCY0110]|uniref:Biosynthetic arginine decarboxylase n=1 Tax=Crocosphaera chwakensis CCY0110 TaxID=391612 RepID=A3ILQ1_9CHRO|nr:biosynthetic arginine decarboxylase [Crocosphaera chwakensis]EAZ92702.1 arginine decarboxylase [Crocosphaera chwakensis CCY0110]